MWVSGELTIEKLEELFRTYYTELVRYAFTIVREQGEAEDIVQHLFVKLWEKREDLAIRKDVRSYLYRSTYNASVNAWKRTGRFTGTGESLQQVSASGQSSDRVLSSELEARIEQAVQSLPEKCREVFMLSRFSELSYKEIADQLGISVKTVENHMGKALSIMRSQLSDYLPQLLITILLAMQW